MATSEYDIRGHRRGQVERIAERAGIRRPRDIEHPRGRGALRPLLPHVNPVLDVSRRVVHRADRINQRDALAGGRVFGRWLNAPKLERPLIPAPPLGVQLAGLDDGLAGIAHHVYVDELGDAYIYEADGLGGFSLKGIVKGIGRAATNVGKTVKKAAKDTVNEVKRHPAIYGAAAAIAVPFVAPAVGAGALAVGKKVLGGVKAAGRAIEQVPGVKKVEDFYKGKAGQLPKGIRSIEQIKGRLPGRDRPAAAPPQLPMEPQPPLISVGPMTPIPEVAPPSDTSAIDAVKKEAERAKRRADRLKQKLDAATSPNGSPASAPQTDTGLPQLPLTPQAPITAGGGGGGLPGGGGGAPAPMTPDPNLIDSLMNGGKPAPEEQPPEGGESAGGGLMSMLGNMSPTTLALGGSALLLLPAILKPRRR